MADHRYYNADLEAESEHEAEAKAERYFCLHVSDWTEFGWHVDATVSSRLPDTAPIDDWSPEENAEEEEDD